MKSLIRRLFGLAGANTARGSTIGTSRWRKIASPAACYCIGDTHGCLGLLRQIEEQIVADGASVSGEKWIVLLGDMIDRGPNSAQIIDHLLGEPPEGFQRYCLTGNHEQGMLDFLDRPVRDTWWLEHGGHETLASYGIDVATMLEGRMSSTERRLMLSSYVPEEHQIFLRSLPELIETPDWILVHAGLKPGIPLLRQTTEMLLWYRDDLLTPYDEWGKLVVHGHTPQNEVFLSSHRIDVDTGACLTGRLSAVRLVPGEPPLVLSVTGPAN
jgi:serine/threonine protein phosphatase 1